MRSTLPALLVPLALAACAHDEPAATGSAAVDSAATALSASADGWQPFGAAVSAETPMPLSAVIARADEFNGKQVVVTGTVDAVCKKKGCWMTLHDGDHSARITFKDYGFFVPLDCERSEVVADGVFEVKSVPLDEARHYLEDAGKHAEAAALTGPQTEYRLVASGVRLRAPQAGAAVDQASGNP